jgi:hypothetical protein
MRHPRRAQRVLKPRMDGGRIDQVCGPKLLDTAQTLKFRRVHQLDFERRHLDIAVDRITDEFSFSHAPGNDTFVFCAVCAFCGYFLCMDILHTFFDIEVEPVDSPDEIYLVKVLSVDGRRFTYELHAPLTDEAVAYIKGLLDAVVFNDVIIESSAEGFELRDAPARLKKHG